MPTEKLSMRKIKEVLRLHYEESATNREIARRLNIGAGSVSRYLTRAQAAKLVWPLPDDWNEDKTYQVLFPSTSKNPTHQRPNFGKVHNELKRLYRNSRGIRKFKSCKIFHIH